MSLTKVSYSLITGAPINVKDFGAVGNGAADDTAAIQAAIDYCTIAGNRKQTLYFPASNPGQFYKITAPLVIKGSLNIIGDGEFSTLIYAVGLSSSQYILDFDNLSTDVVQFGGVSNITLRSDNKAPRGIRLNNTSYWTIRNITLYSLSIGIFITGGRCFSNSFEQITHYDITGYSVRFEDFTGGGQYEFLSCTFTGADGVYFTGNSVANSLAFYNCNFEQCLTTDIYINGTVGGLTISGGRSEGLDGNTSFLIDPAAGNLVSGVCITGCFWTGDVGNAYPIQLGGSGGDVKGFSVTGNHVGNMGFLGFVRLNGAGLAGVICGNYCQGTPADKIVSAPKQGVVSFSNYNASGAMVDYENLVVINRASAAPVSGTYAVGSIVYNSAPTAGGFIGWVCVTAGTPGTWKTFGAISA